MTINFLKKIFQQMDQETPAPSTQTQREALLDLLVWMIFVDHLIAAPEEEQIRQQMQRLAWEGARPLEIYFNSAIRRTRELLDKPSAQDKYLEGIAQRLDTAEAKQRALRACQEMAAIDGDVAEAEAQLLDQIRSCFGLDLG